MFGINKKQNKTKSNLTNKTSIKEGKPKDGKGGKAVVPDLICKVTS